LVKFPFVSRLYPRPSLEGKHRAALGVLADLQRQPEKVVLTLEL